MNRPLGKVRIVSAEGETDAAGHADEEMVEASSESNKLVKPTDENPRGSCFDE
jgi:hypothetical protein